MKDEVGASQLAETCRIYCGKSYIGETRRMLKNRLREHQEACRKGTLDMSAVAEHAWKDHHAIKWDETTVVDMARHRTNRTGPTPTDRLCANGDRR